ncbi:gliding motility lipoprotein GldB [Maribacter polysiphoniae]|uniref:Gliding motility lipoprotein GldB n=1 Tax=Maribacter polysiphoniae TaxID=429344 RepID=A0A316E0B9_9FLAO|nr:gliding motility lipoprotein GldB [Maribacter polysiphoniae]MBD1261859.1 gliding motility lipoprotein GldB [Maribacter polysiphoniae]PWK22223.1 protein involved in gliding motility GldB [Maribacter polysiphoniae]
MKKSFYLLVLLTFVVMGCKNEDKIEAEVKKIPLVVQVSRFDNEFAKATPSDIPKLRKEYPYFFPAPDSVWVAKLQDSLQIELRGEVMDEFSDFENEVADIELLFKYIKYYFPKYSAPKIITVTNDVDHENRIILTDTLLLVGLDNYLGADHRYYTGIQKYIAAGMDRKYIVSDIANAYAQKIVPRLQGRTFLDRMIYYGKILYLKDKIMPFQTDGQKINYSEDELAWAMANEEPMWRHFIERELLYSTDNKLTLRFLDPAPFSKFGLELDNESPGRLGRYVGWRIVRSFMNKNEVSLQQLMNLPAEDIFKKSNYKPNK